MRARDLRYKSKFFFRLLFGEVPRIIFGNDAGFANNVVGGRPIRRAIGISSGLRSSRARDTSQQIRARGFADFAMPYPAELINAIRAGYESLIADDASCRDMAWSGPAQNLRHVVEPIHLLPRLSELVTPEVIDVANAYYDGNAQIGHVRMWRIEHSDAANDGVDVFGNLWHTDQHPLYWLKLFVQISADVTADRGAFRFQELADTKRIMRSGFVHPQIVLGPAKRHLEDEQRVHIFDGPPGTATFCNTELCLHRAGNPAPGVSRGMVQITFMPSAGPLVPDWAATLAPDTAVADYQRVT